MKRSVGKEVKKLKPYTLLVGFLNILATKEVSQLVKKFNIELPYDAAGLLLGIENRCSNKNLYTNVQSNPIHSIQKVEIIQIFIKRQMDTRNVAYPFNGTLFGHKNKWNYDTCYNTDEPCKHYSKWKKPDMKGYVLYDSTHIKYPEEASP